MYLTKSHLQEAMGWVVLCILTKIIEDENGMGSVGKSIHSYSLKASYLYLKLKQRPPMMV